jgi:hypothetical protein
MPTKPTRRRRAVVQHKLSSAKGEWTNMVRPSMDPTVFERAAELVASREPSYLNCCCYALDDVGDERRINTLSHEELFEAVLKPEGAYAYWYHGMSYRDGPETTEHQTRTARVLGLLLVAELAREGWTA